MMITGIEIENFKGIRERVKIDLRPITLLFGANSAGKSTVFHAIHYLREVFENRNFNADRTSGGGSYVDLGGFENLVNGHDRNREIRLAITLDVEGSTVFDWTSDEDGPVDETDIIASPATIGVEVAVAWSDRLNAPYCREYVLKVDAEKLLAVESTPGTPSQRLRVFCSHPNLNSNESSTATNDYGIESAEQCTALFAQFDFTGVGLKVPPPPPPHGSPNDFNNVLVDVNCGEDALPVADKPLQVAGIDFKSPVESDLYAEISAMLYGPLKTVRSSLQSMKYLGPLRETPPRNYASPRFPDAARWASGLGAWDTLHAGSESFVEAVSGWLGDKDRLNAGYRIESRRFKEIDLADPLIVKLVTGRAFDEADQESKIDLEGYKTHSKLVIVPANTEAAKAPRLLELRPHDVGIGISQVVPVIVTALDGSERLLAIEQPELHIHPRLQAEIADLFIEAIHKNKHCFIIETHSEHLILRLLRRIRETELDKAPDNRRLRTDELAIYYLKQEGGSSRASAIDVDVKGEFIQPWPDDFFEIDFYERFPDAR